MLNGNEFYCNKVNPNLNYGVSDLSRRKKNENYCMAAARKSIEWSDVEIKQIQTVLLEKEKLMFKNMPVFFFHISIVKKLFITLERF